MEWHLPTNDRDVRAADGGVIVVACERLHGGLHTSQPKADRERGRPDVEICLNDKEKDGFSLRVKPPDRTDYFHAVPDEDVRKLLQSISSSSIWPIPACRTIYSWPINENDLDIGKPQVLSIKLVPQILWDIDYVVLVLRIPKNSLHPEVVRVIFLFLGALLTFFGALILKFLFR